MNNNYQVKPALISRKQPSAKLRFYKGNPTYQMLSRHDQWIDLQLL